MPRLTNHQTVNISNPSLKRIILMIRMKYIPRRQITDINFNISKERANRSSAKERTKRRNWGRKRSIIYCRSPVTEICHELIYRFPQFVHFIFYIEVLLWQYVGGRANQLIQILQMSQFSGSWFIFGIIRTLFMKEHHKETKNIHHAKATVISPLCLFIYE